MTTSYFKKAREKHSWKPSIKEAQKIQEKLRYNIILKDNVKNPKLLAGADVGFNKKQNQAKAAVVVLKASDLSLVDKSVVQMEINFPYVPGYLSFREAPPLLKALDRLDVLPDVILCDSQGYAHPRRFGLACHLGVLTGFPTVGVAKSKLIGEYDELSARKGAAVSLIHDNERIGLVLRTRTNVNPLFVSVGHKISLKKARKMVLHAVTRYKLPETTRLADRLASFH